MYYFWYMKANTNKVDQFLQDMAAKATQTARRMAALELSVWDAKHEAQLKQHYGFTDDTLAARKRDLKAASK